MELRLSQNSLCQLTGFQRGYISDLERGKRSFGLKTPVKLTKALNLSPSDLVWQAEQELTHFTTEFNSSEDENEVAKAMKMLAAASPKAPRVRRAKCSSII